jgi:hypothetical protein
VAVDGEDAPIPGVALQATRRSVRRRRMSPGTIVFLVVCVAIIGLVVYLATSQSEIPTRLRRVLKMNIDNKSDDAPARAPRGAAPVAYTHLRAHQTDSYLGFRLEL